MVKSKLKPLAAVVLNRNNRQKSFARPPNLGDDLESPGEDNWVLVKKQKVTIWIPHLPNSEQCVLPNLDLSDGQLIVDLQNNVSSAQPQLQHPKSSDICLAERNDGSMFPLDSLCQPSLRVHAPQDKLAAIVKPGKQDLRIQFREKQVSALGPLCRKKRSVLNRKSHKSSRIFEPPEHSRLSCLPSCTTVLNKMMRASNLEGKIARIGGLRRWLSSLGLQQFERNLRGKSVGKFQLVNLSMKKLKDMGYHAVGPRRKLIHAIECACQSPCSETLHRINNF